VIEGRVIEENIETGKNVTGRRRKSTWRRAS